MCHCVLNFEKIRKKKKKNQISVREVFLFRLSLCNLILLLSSSVLFFLIIYCHSFHSTFFFYFSIDTKMLFYISLPHPSTAWPGISFFFIYQTDSFFIDELKK